MTLPVFSRRSLSGGDVPALGISIFFLGLLLLVSLPNHYNFRTYALDLGYYMQMCEFYLRGKFFVGWLTTALPWADKGIAPPSVYGNWSVLLAVPFYVAGQAWGLLVFQALLFVVGGWGIYRIAQHLFGERGLALWSLVHYYGMWGIWSAAAFDFHEVAIAVAAIPWALLFHLRGRMLSALAAWLLALGSKEIFGFWGVFLWTGWAFLFRKINFALTRTALYLALLSGVYGLFLTLVGTLWAERSVGAVSRTSLYYAHLFQPDPFAAYARQIDQLWTGFPREYSLLYLIKLLLKPKIIWALLWESPNPTYMGIKSELYWSFLVSGGWAVFAAPVFIWILSPIFLYKMLSTNYFMWGTLAHYGLELALMVPILIAWVFRNHAWRRWGVPVTALLAHITQLSLLDSRLSKWYDPVRHRWYQKQHYESSYSYSAIHAGLEKIPSDTPVSAVSCLISHIPSREKLYHFPAVGDAKYIALLQGKDACTYPLSPAEYLSWVDSVLKVPEWHKIHDEAGLLILERRDLHDSSLNRSCETANLNISSHGPPLISKNVLCSKVCR